ncbi:hypothetical protein AXG93_4515s1000 [Marchantia polymorpha subsp. ruderalis]|uniref:Uncharacterized protein n=1 Tax=Marchantia polymorpha subsp. ruderalis TaxID=1480154 RepID=A0A176VG11_MARPO|nr:hypothetical protein AXG93_4515s1000 [Marchantia polymorpha subsp. ruderalis]
MVREWQKERDQPTRGFRPHVERWVIEDWEQVNAFGGSNSLRSAFGPTPSAVRKGPSGQGTLGELPSAQPPSSVDAFGAAPSEQDLTEERNDKQKREARVQSAQLQSAQTSSAQPPSTVDAIGDAELVVTGRASGASLSQPKSPTALDILAGSSEAAAVADDADTTKPHSRESPENSVVTEIVNLKDDEEGETESGSGSGEEEEQSVAGTPTAALCELVVPLLRYLDRKVTKYADSR